MLKPTFVLLLAALLTSGAHAGDKPDTRAKAQRAAVKRLEIRGGPVFTAKTKEALALLEGSTTFTTVSPYIAVIEESTRSGMVAWTAKPVYQVGSATWNHGAAWYAGTIAHDGCHSLLYHKARAAGNGKVPAEAWTGKTAEQDCLKVQSEVLLEIKADTRLITYVNSLIENPAYQNISYSSRNW
ncbi:MAG: hypothetical protein PHV36_06425 [Elusimicrobiales bacterium]|nr:hypothetical protein [Elusimicrobiales bacterium]